jgi:hypothetical protein
MIREEIILLQEWDYRKRALSPETARQLRGGWRGDHLFSGSAM